MRESGRRIFEGHRPRQAENLARTDVRRQPNPADSRSAGDIVDDDDPFHPGLRIVEMDRFGRSQRISPGVEYVIFGRHREKILFGWPIFSITNADDGANRAEIPP